MLADSDETWALKVHRGGMRVARQGTLSSSAFLADREATCGA